MKTKTEPSIPRRKVLELKNDVENIIFWGSKNPKTNYTIVLQGIFEQLERLLKPTNRKGQNK